METAIGILIMFITLLALEASNSYLEGKRDAYRAWKKKHPDLSKEGGEK